MSYSVGAAAGDRYRVLVTRGSMFSGLLKLSRKRQAAVVSIIDGRGEVVWKRSVQTTSEASELVDLIRTQVLTARLEDFEHWLHREGRVEGES